jgi:metal-responsive CopG/Arc/MetJ family transcriptional regulator
MKSVAKVAVSMPVDTLRSLERVRVRLRKTRSGAVTEAVERWLRAEEVGDDERRYLEGYLRKPERNEESHAVASAAIASWEPWE